jgi:hypothetical protein
MKSIKLIADIHGVDDHARVALAVGARHVDAALT